MKAVFNDLKEKRILITGPSRGIGRSIACELAKQKAHLLLQVRPSFQGRDELKSELLELGASQVEFLEFDLKDTDIMKEVVTAYIKEHGGVDGLVNNAGVSKDQLLLRTKASDIEDVLKINLHGPLFLTALLGRGFLKGKNVSIVNISSIVGLMGNTAQTTYAASKSGLIGMTKSVAKELASRNIRCNAIAPGFIETKMTQELDPAVQESYLGNIPLKRFGNPEEVASLTSFLLSDASSYITGEVIKIDGGLYI